MLLVVDVGLEVDFLLEVKGVLVLKCDVDVGGLTDEDPTGFDVVDTGPGVDGPAGTVSERQREYALRSVATAEREGGNEALSRLGHKARSQLR